MQRSPAVAGQFYYADAPRLHKQMGQYVTKNAVKEKVIGVMSPHAGLMYSGPVAGAVYSSVQFPKTFVLIGPNHTGIGEKLSMMGAGQWNIPTGTFPIDESLARRIRSEAPLVSEDVKAHVFEHSLEVQLPFMSCFSSDVRIVPITVMSASLEECETVGRGIGRSVEGAGYEIVIVASSDMSHYVSEDTARRLDNLALAEMLRLDPEGLYNTVMREKITMCGVLPATIMLYAALELGAKEARLVKYSTSGEVSGDHEHVVGYAGVIIK